VEQQNNLISRGIPDKNCVEIRSSLAATNSAASTTRKKKVSGVSDGSIFKEVKICSFAILLEPEIHLLTKFSRKVFQSERIARSRDFSQRSG
jgi:hypothetical protein